MPTGAAVVKDGCKAPVGQPAAIAALGSDIPGTVSLFANPASSGEAYEPSRARRACDAQWLPPYEAVSSPPMRRSEANPLMTLARNRNEDETQQAIESSASKIDHPVLFTL